MSLVQITLSLSVDTNQVLLSEELWHHDMLNSKYEINNPVKDIFYKIQKWDKKKKNKTKLRDYTIIENSDRVVRWKLISVSCTAIYIRGIFILVYLELIFLLWRTDYTIYQDLFDDWLYCIYIKLKIYSTCFCV